LASHAASSPNTAFLWGNFRTAFAAAAATTALLLHAQVEHGRSDALAWAEAVGFTRSGQPYTTFQRVQSAKHLLLLLLLHAQVERGRNDALAWAEAVGFTRSGQPIYPPAQHYCRLQPCTMAAAAAAVAAAAAQVDPTGWLMQQQKQQKQQLMQPSPTAAAAAAVGARQLLNDPLVLVGQGVRVPPQLHQS
jgi:hypothetical protein